DHVEEAIERDHQAAELAEEKPLKHKAFHNKGNAFFQQKKYPEAIEAYKDALRNNPGDEETRYNLALAKKMWEQEKQDGGGDSNQDKDGDQQEEQKEDDQQGNDPEQDQDQDGEQQKKEGGDQQDEQQKDPESQGEGQKPQDQNEGEKPIDQQQQQPQQPVPGQLSPQQIKSLLEAMGNEERK